MIRMFLAVVLAVFAFALSPVWGQEPSVPNYEAWDRVATQSEQLAEDGETTASQLESIRARIADWRDQFEDAQGINGARIDTVQGQIEALGPVPAEGATEPDDIAARRTELQDQLAQLQAPRLAAVEAFSRADAIVRQIDQTVSERQVSELARLSTSPVLPGNWVLAASETMRLVDGIWQNTSKRISERATWPELRPRLPQVVGYLIAAVILLALGRMWVIRLPSRLSARAMDYSRAVVAFTVSLAQIVLPMIGLYLLINAMKATGIFGEWTRPFLDALPVAGVMLFGSAWLAQQLLPAKSVAYDTLNMSPDDRLKARWLVNTLALVLAVHHIASAAFLPLSGLSEKGPAGRRVPLEFSEGAAVVWHFVLILLAAALLFRLGSILRRLKPWAETNANGYRHRVLAFAGALTRILCVAAVLAAAIGYVNIGNLLVWPWIETLAMLGLLILLQDFIADIFNMLKRGQEGAREGLAPLLIGFALVLFSIPIFLLIWGASGNELAEYWNRFRQGATLGGVRLSPGAVLMFLLVFAIGYSITRAVQGALRTSVLPKTKLDAGGQNAVVSGTGYVGVVLAAMLAITSAGIDLSSFAIVAGALSVGIGFGLQNIVSNFVSGIILLIERPVSVGDWISAGGQQGIVKRISVRSTQVETFDRQQVIVPNSDLISQPVTNWTRHSKTGRIIIPIGVSYGVDTRLVARILREIIEDQPLVTIDPAPAVLFRSISVDSLNFEIRAVISDIGSGLGVTSEVYHQIVERFIAEGIGMPFTPRDTWGKGDDLPDMDEEKADDDDPIMPIRRSAQTDLPD